MTIDYINRSEPLFQQPSILYFEIQIRTMNYQLDRLSLSLAHIRWFVLGNDSDLPSLDAH
jgi:hypothetical protein